MSPIIKDLFGVPDIMWQFAPLDGTVSMQVQFGNFADRFYIFFRNGEIMKRVFIALIASFSIIACSTPPVKLVNFHDEAIRRFDNRTLNIEEVEMDIRQAAAKTGWDVEPGVLPGHMTATHDADGKASAKVDIAYDVHKYSITYISSKKLDYKDQCKNSDGAQVKNCIRPDYNDWVTELNEAIHKELLD